ANMVTLPEGKDYNDYLDPDSVREYKGAKLEAALASAGSNERFQFVRNGYFIKDSKNPNVWNNIVNLEDSWAKAQP
ncbi:MAG: glutamine--tRNA ligase, partial [Clostridia bacterium]|nr:glutamine--tRNA ligase [Clostridia bacterium]